MCKPCAEEKSLSCIELGEMVPLKAHGGSTIDRVQPEGVLNTQIILGGVRQAAS